MEKVFLKQLLTKEPLFHTVWLYIIAHDGETISLASIAQHVNISTMYANKILAWGIQAMDDLKVFYSPARVDGGFIITFTKPSAPDVNGKKYQSNDNHRQIIDYLNLKAKTEFRHNSKSTILKINARFAENYSVQDFLKVIDIKVAEWINTESEKYLRPETLFGPKFESYLNQKINGQTIKETQLRKPSNIERTFQTGRNVVDKIFRDSERRQPEAD